MEHGIERMKLDAMIFILRASGAAISIHADDILIAASAKQAEEILDLFEKEFRIKRMGQIREGEWTKYLGLLWTETTTGYEVKVPIDYMRALLKFEGLSSAKPVNSPFPREEARRESDEALSDKEQHKYRQTLGRLLWILPARPDLAYSLKQLARGMTKATKYHRAVLTRLLRYVQGTTDMTVSMTMQPRDPLDKVVAVRGFADSNWGQDFDGRSTSGGCLYLGDFLLLHYARTQATVSQSSCEAELLAMNLCCREGQFVRGILEELGFQASLESYTDNTSATAVTARRGTGKMRNLRLRQLWLLQEVRAGRVVIRRVSSQENVADLFTKYLPNKGFQALVQQIGMRAGAETRMMNYLDMSYMAQRLLNQLRLTHEELPMIAMITLEGEEQQQEEGADHVDWMLWMWLVLGVLGLRDLTVRMFARMCRRRQRVLLDTEEPKKAEPEKVDTAVQTEPVKFAEDQQKQETASEAASSSAGPRSRGTAMLPFRCGQWSPYYCECGLHLRICISGKKESIGRLYVSCPKHPSDPTRCSFFRWM